MFGNPSLRARILVCWWTILYGPIAATLLVLIGAREQNPWVFYVMAATVPVGMIWAIVRLRRLRREQKATSAAPEE
jgi:hypothetical protein